MSWRLAMASVWMLTACTVRSRHWMPTSDGHPYEVLLVAADSTAGELLSQALRTDVKGMPQQESQFDVIWLQQIAPPQTPTARNVVIVETDATQYPTTVMHYETNVYTQPQVIVRIGTPSTRQLQADLQARPYGAQLRWALLRHERKAQLAYLQQNHNERAAQLLSDRLKVSMLVPTDLSKSKTGKDFVWFSNDAAQAMRNICVYSYPGQRLDTRELTAKRDSIMRCNIPGERDGMYMKTVEHTVCTDVAPPPSGAPVQSPAVLTVRGLWEMEGDMMGGPFVAMAMADAPRNRIVVSEAFVYAPEQNKRNLMGTLETALTTTNLETNR